MERDTGLRLDGIVSGVRSQLDWLAHAAKVGLSDEEYHEVAEQIGIAMGALYEVSDRIYRQFPDVVPRELRPPVQE